jgi:cadmium resistance transport/sequestration family protein
VIDPLLAAIGGSITTFAATNVDDLFLLTLFFAHRIPARRIVAGQYLGFAAIILISLLGAFAALKVPHQWIRLLGLVPLALGFRQLLNLGKGEDETAQFSSAIVSIALVTLSNGGDNVGVYVPFFVIARAYLPVILGVYAILIAVLCLAGRWLGNHRLVLRAVDRWGHWIVPLVFIGLGIFVLRS